MHNDTNTLGQISPFFIVNDIHEAIAFYEQKLGFTVDQLLPEDDPFFAIVQRDRVRMFLKAVADDVPAVPNHARHPFARIDAFVFTETPDAFAEEFAERGVSFPEPLADTEDGLRGFVVEDADGYRLFFGCPRMTEAGGTEARGQSSD